MKLPVRIPVLGLGIALILAACAPSQTGRAGQAGQDSPKPLAVKRIVAAIRGVPTSMLQQRTQRGGSIRGLDGIEELTSAGFSYLKADGTRAAQLAEAVPTLDNGLWKLLPDGKMETTWKIRQGATWHDGKPIVADDFLFTTVF